MHNITLTQCGQLRAYANSTYAGTVKATSEQDARDQLQAYRGGRPILDKQAEEFGECFRPFFTCLREIEPGVWKFSITEEYTG